MSNTTLSLGSTGAPATPQGKKMGKSAKSSVLVSILHSEESPPPEGQTVNARVRTCDADLVSVFGALWMTYNLPSGESVCGAVTPTPFEVDSRW